MAKHPRTFVPSSDTSSSYGDGGFFFTQPVGAGGGYADGGFFFTQPVGAGGGYAGPNRAARRASGFVHPAYAGAGGYGAPPRIGAANLKMKGLPVAAAGGGSSSSTRGSGIASKPETKAAAATAKPEVVKAYEDANILVGENQFWADYWSAVKRAAGSKFSTTSANEKKGWDDALAAAQKAATAAYDNMVAGLPPFPVRENGLPTGDAYKALSEYQSSLIEKGRLKQAFRKASGGKRDPSMQQIITAILRDVRDPFMDKVFTTTSKGKTVWGLRGGVDSKPYASTMMAYMTNDPMLGWSRNAGDWNTKYWRYWYDKDRKGGVGGKPQNVDYEQSSDYALNFDTNLDDDFETNDERRKVAKSYTSYRLLNAVFGSEQNTTTLKSARTPWETRNASNPARVTSARTAWENARKTFVQTARTAEQLTIDQQNNAVTAKTKAAQAETAFDKARDFAAAALSARQGAEGAALVADVAGSERYAAAAETAAKDARTQADAALRLAQEVTSLAARAGGLATSDKQRADAASVSAERSASEARESADAATAQIAVAKSAVAVKQAEEEAKRAAEEKAKQDAALADANAKAQGAQAAADAAKAAADRAAAGVANGTVSAADAEAARRKYEELQAVAAAEAAKAGAEQAKADLAKAEAERIEALAAAERDKKDEITKDVFTPGEQEPGRLAKPKMVSGDLAPTSEDGFFAKYKTPILVTSLILGGAALAWHLTRNR